MYVAATPGKPGGQCRSCAGTGSKSGKKLFAAETTQPTQILLTPANLPAGTSVQLARSGWRRPSNGRGKRADGRRLARRISMMFSPTRPQRRSRSPMPATPSTGGCAGAPQDVVITVNPTPVVGSEGQVEIDLYRCECGP